MKATTYNKVLASLILTALSLPAGNVSAGWLGYDSYEECFAAERQERMDRWISPMNAVNASVAAQDACRKYYKPPPVFVLDPEHAQALREQQQRDAQAREEKMRNFRGPCTYEAHNAGYCTMQQNLDYEAQRSIESERQLEESRRRLDSMLNR
jgi:ribosomal protein L15E